MLMLDLVKWQFGGLKVIICGLKIIQGGGFLKGLT